MKTGEPTFMTLVLLGKIADPATAIDDYVERWHASDEIIQLHEYLGLSRDDYGAWLQDPKALWTIIADARKRWNAIVSREAP